MSSGLKSTTQYIDEAMFKNGINDLVCKYYHRGNIRASFLTPIGVYRLHDRFAKYEIPGNIYALELQETEYTFRFVHPGGKISKIYPKSRYFYVKIDEILV